ncbi:MAG: twin-arginine translocase subunit TatC [Candidatus Omnitrophica bacterium]|nr:twin-arginine translocase subunit TatC [Candidatus Omnitrophota bacterium]MDD5352753.1 twin-arginine translocase subunit TatC [Candidatus Omnitrophota bacterium]MDD5550352.1 twin-arginine translocase subunit TatC [Candidatus Omnitrophota bacterium]
MPDKKLTLIQHLEELRSRIIKSIIFITAAFFIAYGYVDKLLPVLIKPIGKLVFTSPSEAFVANIKIAFWLGLFLSSPFLLYQIWQFISGGLKDNEKKYALILGFFSFVLFVTGCAFGYLIIIPIGMKFLLGFATDLVTPMITISNYISFLGVITFIFGLVFQLPLVVIFLVKLGIVKPKLLSRKRREVIVIIFIVAAVLTPPDVITQLLMAIPLVVLYELSILLSRIFLPRREIKG